VKTTLLVLTNNELVGVKAIMPRVNRNWVDQILIVDAASHDGTIEWCRENNYELFIQSRSGIRHGFTDALTKIRGDIVITFSPDGNCIPELIPELLTEINKGFDMVIVSRYLDDARSEDDTRLSQFGNWFFTKSINLFHGGNYTDSMGIYRAYRKQIIYELALNDDKWFTTPERLFGINAVGWEPLLSVRAARSKLRVSEIKGDEPARLEGKSRVFPSLRVQLMWAAVYYFQIIRDIAYWKYTR